MRWFHGCAVSLVFATACSGTAESVSPVPTEREPSAALAVTSPSAVGPYAIGVTTIETTDASPDGRTLPIDVWYPALPQAGAEVAQYKLVVGVLELASVESPLGAVRDAEADLRGAPHPVIVFSHGYGGVRFQSLYLTEYLATHGFVVAAPDHVGNTFADQIASANALPAGLMGVLRPKDVSRTLDEVVRRSNDDTSLLRWMVDESRAGVAGHSFGGFTTFRSAGATVKEETLLSLCAADPGETLCNGWDTLPFEPSVRDPRFLAAMPQAPGAAVAFAPDGYADLAIPTMIQGGTLDETTPFEEESAAPFAAMHVSGYLIGIKDAGHFTFSNMCDLVDLLGLTSAGLDDGCSEANIPAEKAHPLINTYATAFMQVYVAGHPELSAELDTSKPLPDGVATFLSK